MKLIKFFKLMVFINDFFFKSYVYMYIFFEEINIKDIFFGFF